MSLLGVAERVEVTLHNAFTMKGDDFGFSLPNSMLVGITLDENGNLANVNPEVASHGDIYQLLDDEKAVRASRNFDAVALVTCGWAAPIDHGNDEPETAPSQHPQRRRVRLVLCATLGEVASVLRFQDEADNPILDGGEAKGPLAEAIQDFLIRAKG